MRWTKKEDEKLKEYINSGMTHEEISTKMRRTTFAIRARASNLELKSPNGNRPWKTSEYRKILQCYNEGMLIRDIAAEMGTSYATMRGMIYNARKRGDLGYRYNVRSVSGAKRQN